MEVDHFLSEDLDSELSNSFANGVKMEDESLEVFFFNDANEMVESQVSGEYS